MAGEAGDEGRAGGVQVRSQRCALGLLVVEASIRPRTAL